LQNNFGQTTSTNNRVFNIKDESKNLKRGEKLKVEFFVKSAGTSKIPFVTAVKLNKALICPEEQPPKEGEVRCAKVEMSDDGVGGRWDGVLTVYPQRARNGIRVDIELDEPAWALGVSL
jgi:hypothetical protein